ncbi:MAG TPA: hypothetical protein EYP41_17865 [Anaerolineae bacterium]|nr:hypothetical protein [Anaerolineae bacterium]
MWLKKLSLFILAGFGLLALFAIFMMGLTGSALAQTPRPTPTNIPSPTPPVTNDTEIRGSIQGVVYRDVNGDGRCVNTGIAGEEPVAGIPIEFVSSDEATIITATSGHDGTYGLFAAGQSYWRVTAKPEAGWIVTSENPQYVPVYPDSRGHTGIDFCVQEGAGNGVIILPSAAAVSADGTVVLLPEAGAPQAEANVGWMMLMGVTAVLGFIIFSAGAFLHFRRS